jgi:exodeoxyribonuclease X
MSAIVIDTETTGIDDPDVIELARSEVMETPATRCQPIYRLRWRPNKAISCGAMAAHHIIPSDLSAEPTWPGRWRVPDGVEYLIGHNVDFDWKAIGSPTVKRICTWTLARRHWPDVDSHSLGALIYHMFPPSEAREMLQEAHSASIDVGLCYEVLTALLAHLQVTSWAQLWELSEQARVPTHFTFGKYAPDGAAPGPRDGKLGVPIAWVRENDRGYVKWCLSSCDIVTGDPYWQRALTQ